MKIEIVIVAGAIAFLGIHLFFTRPLASGTDVIPIATYKEPIQVDITDATPITFTQGKLHLTYRPVANYRIAARILHNRGYHGDWSAKIAPYDLALGWGDAAEKEYMKGIKVSQMLRFYMYHPSRENYDKIDYIAKHSANCHIIPATKNLRYLLRTLRKNDIVELEGFLVIISGSDKRGTVGWSTSTTRDDTGNGACELIYVNKIKHDGKIYK